MKNEENFQMVGEAATLFKISEVGDKFFIEIQGEKKFKNIWIVKLNQLNTNMKEVNYYNQEELE